jgi:hypothetical protein
MPESGRIVANAGLKAMSGENVFPSVKGIPALQVKVMHIEHTIVEITDGTVNVDVGDKIEFWVHFLDPTLLLTVVCTLSEEGRWNKSLQVER